MRWPGVLLSFLWLTGAALAEESGITITDVWSRAAPVGRPGVVYLTATDNGAPDRLLGVSTPVAERAELHESFAQGGVMKMRPVDAAPIAPGKPLRLAPGGNHIMLMGLKRPLKEGDTFPITLKFEHAGAVEATALVRNPRAAG
ncbi:MAG: copper chaperone PCu(A)C [Acetobacteraceae bacterium]|nr:copper chaperone PCu(A)C [Acetobacteraceae bacterium]